MTHFDKLAIRAATARVSLINYVVAHPKQPVPAELVRAEMDAIIDLCMQNLADVLQSATSSPELEDVVRIAPAKGPDPQPDKAA